MLKAARIPTALVLLAFAAGGVVACGGGVPGDSVATVDGDSIKKSEYDRWFAIAARSGQPDPKQVVVPDSPNFTKCIAKKRELQPKPPTGKGKEKAPKPPTTAQLKKECKSLYDQLNQSVMQFLIFSEWVDKEAKDRDIKVTDAEVNKQFEQQKKAAFPKEKDFEKFVKNSGSSVEDLKFRVRLDLTAQKIQEKVTAKAKTATDAEVAAYYKKNRKQFVVPEARDLQIILTQTKAKAEQAKSAVEGGQSFAKVAKKYSIDEASKRDGGKLPAVARGTQEPGFDKAIFSAKKGVLSGPVKTQFGYYVFKVTKVVPGSTQELSKVKESIKQQVITEKQNKALTKFRKDFNEKWRDETECRKSFVIAECENAPESKKNAAPSGVVPQTGGGAPTTGGTTQPPTQQP